MQLARALLAAAAVAVGGVAWAAPASAHNYVVDADPAADQVVDGPVEQVTMTFNDVLLDLGGNGTGTGLDVVGPDGAHYATDCPTIDDRSLSAPVALGAGGTYTVDWRVVSADGHPVSGSYTFDYAPPAGATTTAGAPEPACVQADTSGTGSDTGSDTESDAGSDTVSDTGSTGGSGLSAGVLAVIAASVAVIAGGGVLVALRVARRR